MSDEKNNPATGLRGNETLEKLDDIEFEKKIDQNYIRMPEVGSEVKGIVVSASKAEVRLDIDGVLVGVVRGPELYLESDEYTSLKPGDEVEASVVEVENEDGNLELSFRQIGQEKAWKNLKAAHKDNKEVKVRIIDANKGGLLVRYRQIQGFLPVSQLAPENYPRISGGDKSKILEKLKSFVGKDTDVNVITLNEEDDKIIFSEKELWNKKQEGTISKYKVGTIVDGSITAVTDFGVFVSFDENMEGLIHISELAWQRIDSPSSLFKVGEKIKAEIINVEGSKIFLSAKKLMKDPWEAASEKYLAGQVVKGTILKVNPFGLFVKLDDEIHGLAHISQLELKPNQKIMELFKSDEVRDFEIMSISPRDHRLGLKLVESPKDSESKTKESSPSEASAKKEKTKVIEEVKEEKKDSKKTEKAKTTEPPEVKEKKEKVVKEKKK